MFFMLKYSLFIFIYIFPNMKNRNEKKENCILCLERITKKKSMYIYMKRNDKKTVYIQNTVRILKYNSSLSI